MTHARIASKFRPVSPWMWISRIGPGVTALYGPPGAGKTLLLESIAGFVRPDCGRILLDDAILFDAASRVNVPPRRRNCGYVAQHDALFPHMTLRQNLVFPARRFPRLERHRRVGEMIERFQLADSAAAPPAMKPAPPRALRCAVARALIAEPQVAADRRARFRRAAFAADPRGFRRPHPARHRRSRSVLRRRR